MNKVEGPPKRTPTSTITKDNSKHDEALPMTDSYSSLHDVQEIKKQHIDQTQLLSSLQSTTNNDDFKKQLLLQKTGEAELNSSCSQKTKSGDLPNTLLANMNMNETGDGLLEYKKMQDKKWKSMQCHENSISSKKTNSTLHAEGTEFNMLFVFCVYYVFVRICNKICLAIFHYTAYLIY